MNNTLSKIRFYDDYLGNFHMEFLNGSLKIPTNRYGMACIATGCGSGKTTIIKQIIEQKFNEGVIVFCKTIDECNELYDYVMSRVTRYDDPQKLCNTYLHPDEVINLCSEPRFEKQIDGTMRCTNGVDLTWKENTKLVSKKKVVIATHVVLMNTDPRTLTHMDSSISNVGGQGSIINQAFLSTNLNSNQLRQFFLVDEIPLNPSLKKTFRFTDVWAFIEPNPTLVIDPLDPNRKNVIKLDLFRRKAISYQDFKSSYEFAEAIDSRLKITNSDKDNDLNDGRKDLILSSLYHTVESAVNNKMFEKKFNEITTGKKVKDDLSFTIRYNLGTIFCSGALNLRFWIFDGTGDITMKSYPLYSYSMKYDGEKVDVIKIPNHLESRSVEVDKMFNKSALAA